MPIWGLWGLYNGISEIKDARDVIAGLEVYAMPLSNKLINLDIMDCVDTNPKCCDVLKNAIDRALSEAEKGIILRQGFGKTILRMTEIGEKRGPDLLKCRGKCPGKQRGYTDIGGGGDGDKHTNPRSGGFPQKCDDKRPY